MALYKLENIDRSKTTRVWPVGLVFWIDISTDWNLIGSTVQHRWSIGRSGSEQNTKTTLIISLFEIWIGFILDSRRTQLRWVFVRLVPYLFYSCGGWLFLQSANFLGLVCGFDWLLICFKYWMLLIDKEIQFLMDWGEWQ